MRTYFPISAATLFGKFHLGTNSFSVLIQSSVVGTGISAGIFMNLSFSDVPIYGGSNLSLLISETRLVHMCFLVNDHGRTDLPTGIHKSKYSTGRVAIEENIAALDDNGCSSCDKSSKIVLLAKTQQS